MRCRQVAESRGRDKLPALPGIVPTTKLIYSARYVALTFLDRKIVFLKTLRFLLRCLFAMPKKDFCQFLKRTDFYSEWRQTFCERRTSERGKG